MQVDFYILEASSNAQSWFFACQLLEKIYANQQIAYIHTNSREEAERFDALLWTYREDSFLPHQLVQTSADFSSPIVIGYEETIFHGDILLNLSKSIPSFHHQFSQIIEIVFSEPVVQQLARERYKQYRDQGYKITTHKEK